MNTLIFLSCENLKKIVKLIYLLNPQHINEFKNVKKYIVFFPEKKKKKIFFFFKIKNNMNIEVFLQYAYIITFIYILINLIYHIHLWLGILSL